MIKRLSFLLTGALLLALIWFVYRNDAATELQHITGQTMGGINYNIKYIGDVKNIKPKIDRLLEAFNQSLSTYIPDSEISRLNRKGSLVYGSVHCLKMLEASKMVYEATNGAYDPTIGPLIQAWGFGAEKVVRVPDSATVDSLKALVGFDQVMFNDDSVWLLNRGALDFSAIAKGYAVDLVAELMEENGYQNYMVEIGGEARCKGTKDINKNWSLGIEDPTVAIDERKILAVVGLKNRSLATSGNYRNYYKKHDRIFAHIIDPRTGYSSQRHLLSASVFAENCMVADAYSTAFMVMGLDESSRFVDQDGGLDALLIYQTTDGQLKTFISDGIKPFVLLNKTDGDLQTENDNE